ncbi:MAG TPA: hypothetical protein VFF00_02720, partial [Candidatus Elarobacter sp.]|nr:hypothetical protein [Candidatus Elarobacter sp.]
MVGVVGEWLRPPSAQPATSNASGSAAKRQAPGTIQGTIGPMTLAERLAAFTASLSFDALPDEVVASVR